MYMYMYMCVHMTGTRPCLDELVQHQQQMSFDKMIYCKESATKEPTKCAYPVKKATKKKENINTKNIRAKTTH